MLASATPIGLMNITPRRARWLTFLFVVYFFFNSTFLPFGLLYTTVLAPFFYLWALKNGERFVLSKYMLLALPIAICQLVINPDINLFYFSRSFVLYLLVFVSAYASMTLCRRIPAAEMTRLFALLIRLNFFFTILALLLILFSAFSPFWYLTQSEGLRLQLLTYEPSYYATLMVPLVVFAGCRVLFRVGSGYIRNLLMIILPLLLTLSAGVIGGLGLAFVIVTLLKSGELIRKPFVAFALLVAVVSGVAIMSTENQISGRLISFAEGHDSSGAVRTFQSNYVAWKIAEKSSIAVGSGFGQSKEMATEFFDEFWPESGYSRIANAVAGTFSEFGAAGIVLRFALELFFFVKTKVFRSYFRLTLFLFMFIYQFTGSYTTNLAEYVIWILAFVPVFIEFERRNGLRQAVLIQPKPNPR